MGREEGGDILDAAWQGRGRCRGRGWARRRGPGPRLGPTPCRAHGRTMWVGRRRGISTNKQRALSTQSPLKLVMSLFTAAYRVDFVIVTTLQMQKVRFSEIRCLSYVTDLKIAEPGLLDERQ